MMKTETLNLTREYLIILFTNTVSHAMVRCALCGHKGSCPRVERSHSSSAAALREILARYQTA